MERKKGNTPSLASHPKIKPVLITSVVIAAILLLITIITSLIPEEASGGKGKMKTFLVKLTDDWQRINFLPLHSFRLDPIGAIYIKLLDEREFVQIPGENPRLILEKPEGSPFLADQPKELGEIPGLRIFVRAEKGEEAGLRVSTWPISN